ncbi:MAG: site-2 protease family protein [Gemmataceae bacterium]
MFFEPNRTPYDLNFSMFGVPVRVHPLFWLISAVLGWNAIHYGFSYVLVWIACVFVSILVHEMGHVSMGRIFGAEGHIILYGFGGLAIGSNYLSNRWQRIAVAFAGPLAGFIFLALILGALQVLAPDRLLRLTAQIQALLDLPFDRSVFLLPPSWAEAALWNLFLINLFWGLMNLLPIWPLDGGQICKDFLMGWWPRDGLRYSLIISCVLASLLAVNALLDAYGRPLIPFMPFGGFYIAILFALLAVNNYQAYQQIASYQRFDAGEREPWERWDK